MNNTGHPMKELRLVVTSNIELGELAGNGISSDTQADSCFVFLTMGEFKRSLD